MSLFLHYYLYALNRALSISTGSCLYDECVDWIVSMPLIGLSPFLQKTVVSSEEQKKFVSMPLIGLSPFLPSYMAADGSFLSVCQCP